LTKNDTILVTSSTFSRGFPAATDGWGTQFRTPFRNYISISVHQSNGVLPLLNFKVTH